MKVLKFGGSSVANAENIAKVVEIVRGTDGPSVLVLSAMQGTTDRLIDAGRLAEEGDRGYVSKLNEIRTQHQLAIDRLFGGSPARDGINGYLEKKLEDLQGICRGVDLIRELSPRTLDRLIAFGELISTRLVSAHLNSIGLENAWVDSRDLIRTDSNFGAAAVDFGKTNRQIRERFARMKHRLAIVPGFIGCDGNNSITTLGRGGSDYTAAIFAAALDAEVLEIWTDVSGMMTADPRFVRNVRGIERITYREAMELSHFGAKVIYPPTIQPVMAKGIPVRVKNTFAADDAGTLIEAESEDRTDIIRGITSIDRIAV